MRVSIEDILFELEMLFNRGIQNEFTACKTIRNFVKNSLERMQISTTARVINYISRDQGWEETGDVYREHFGLKKKYAGKIKGEEPLSKKTMICKRCSGTGVVPYYGASIECTRCHGKGYHKIGQLYRELKEQNKIYKP